MFKINCLKKLFYHFRNKHLLTTVGIDTNKKIASISFDDGPSSIWTPKILDILDQHKAKATFFVLGKNVEKFPEIVHRAYKAGHAIANHSYDHPSFTLINRSQRFKQLIKTNKLIRKYNYNLFRPPYGGLDNQSRLDLFLYRKDVICWDIEVEDWRYRKPEIITKELNNRLKPGSIILLHDYQEGRSCQHTVSALDMFLSENKDYTFVTVPTLLKSGKRKEVLWIKRRNRKTKYL